MRKPKFQKRSSRSRANTALLKASAYFDPRTRRLKVALLLESEVPALADVGNEHWVLDFERIKRTTCGGMWPQKVPMKMIFKMYGRLGYWAGRSLRRAVALNALRRGKLIIA